MTAAKFSLHETLKLPAHKNIMKNCKTGCGILKRIFPQHTVKLQPKGNKSKENMHSGGRLFGERAILERTYKRNFPP